MWGAPKVGVMYENFWKFWDSTKIKCVKCMGGWGIQPDLIQQLFEDKSVIFQKVRWISVSAFIWDHLLVIWIWDGQVGAQKHVWLDSSPPHTLDHRKSPYRLGLKVISQYVYFIILLKVLLFWLLNESKWLQSQRSEKNISLVP